MFMEEALPPITTLEAAASLPTAIVSTLDLVSIFTSANLEVSSTSPALASRSLTGAFPVETVKSPIFPVSVTSPTASLTKVFFTVERSSTTIRTALFGFTKIASPMLDPPLIFKVFGPVPRTMTEPVTVVPFSVMSP